MRGDVAPGTEMPYVVVMRRGRPVARMDYAQVQAHDERSGGNQVV